MNSRSSKAVALYLSLLVLIVPAYSNAQRRAILPSPPSVMIETLPRPLEGWKVNRSTADTQFMRWLKTTAVRDFEKIAKVKEGDEPATVRVSISDTGRHPSMTGAFKDFEEGIKGPVERLFVKSYPATRMSLGDSGERLQILVKGRFLVEYLYKGMGRDRLKPWLENTNFAQIAAIPENTKRLTRVINVTRIDQIHPERNRTYELSITTTAEVEAILATLEQSGESCE